ncbi:hypothetical protein RQP46_009705 [Phenoliferia psychrophenolica]
MVLFVSILAICVVSLVVVKSHDVRKCAATSTVDVLYMPCRGIFAWFLLERIFVVFHPPERTVKVTRAAFFVFAIPFYTITGVLFLVYQEATIRPTGECRLAYPLPLIITTFVAEIGVDLISTVAFIIPLLQAKFKA